MTTQPSRSAARDQCILVLRCHSGTDFHTIDPLPRTTSLPHDSRFLRMDVIIIGAGAAGLAAAAELARHKRSRPRAGGARPDRRPLLVARTSRDWPFPSRLGAEFIHGRPAATFSLLQKGRYRRRRAHRHPLVRQARKTSPQKQDRIPYQDSAAPWSKAGTPAQGCVFHDLPRPQSETGLSEDERTFALRMVEGYDAADPDRVSARAIVEEWTGEGTANDASFRPLGGYGALHGVAGERARRHGGPPAVAERRACREVEARAGGSRGHVSRQAVPGKRGARHHYACRSACFSFRRAHRARSVSRPRSGRSSARWTASLRDRCSRLLCGFDTAFWEEIENGRYRDAGFFQAPEAAFPTFWTALPMRAPLLVAWAGGPRARRMSDAADVRHDLATPWRA